MAESPYSNRTRSTVKSVASAAARRPNAGEDTTTTAATTTTNPTTPTPRKKVGGLITSAIGRVVNPVMDVVDVDNIIHRIDVNDVVSRIDWNAVVDEIDWNNLLDQVDVDTLIDRIDVNRAVERVDVNSLIERSNLKQIIARSTSGMCSIVLNRFRAICIKFDQVVQRTGRCAWCMCCCPKKQQWTLPPMPTARPLFKPGAYREDREKRQLLKCPKKSTRLATAVQGRNAGTFTRFLAYTIDKGIAWLLAMVGILVVTALVQLLPEDSIPAQAINSISDAATNINDTSTTMANMTREEAAEFLAQEQQAYDSQQTERLVFGIALPIFVMSCLSFVVEGLSMAAVGRTIGKAFMGLVVVNHRFGKVSHIGIWQAICRAFLTNFVTILVWIGTVFSIIREDRRGLVDLFCSTTVIYAWDAKSFRMASDEMAKESPFGGMDFESLSFNEEEDDDVDSNDGLLGPPAAETPPRPTSRTGPQNQSGIKPRVVRVPVPVRDNVDGWNA